MTRPPQRTRIWTLPKLALALLLGAILLGTIPATSFTDATLQRSAGVDVVNDQEGIYSLKTATNVSVGTTSNLVRISNTRTTTEVTATVELQNPPNGVELVVNNTSYGGSATVTIDPDATQQVELTVPDDSTLDGTTIHYTVDVSGTGVVMSNAEREVTINT